MRFREIYFDGSSGARLGECHTLRPVNQFGAPLLLTIDGTTFTSRNNDGLLENAESDRYLVPLDGPGETIHLIIIRWNGADFSPFKEYVRGPIILSREGLETKLRRKYPELHEVFVDLIRAGKYDDTRIQILD